MGLQSYKGSLKVGAGLSPAGEGYALMQACDIQVDESGKRLDAFLAEIVAGANPGQPIEVSSAAEMDRLLSTATADNLGAVYEYKGETTGAYKNGDLYILTEIGE